MRAILRTCAFGATAASRQIKSLFRGQFAPHRRLSIVLPSILVTQRMILKSGNQFSDKIMLKQ
jgi:hypothetical protein